MSFSSINMLFSILSSSARKARSSANLMHFILLPSITTVFCQGPVFHSKFSILRSILFSAFLFVSSYSPFIVMLYIIWYLVLPRTFFAFTIPYRMSFSRQILLRNWPSQFIFLSFISSSSILPSLTLSSTNTFFLFWLSILHAPSFSIAASEMLPVVFAHSVPVSNSLYHTTLHSTQRTSPASSLVLFPRVNGQHIYTNI